MWKRILALMLAMLVCFSAMTMLACANEDDTPDDEGDEAPSGTDDPAVEGEGNKEPEEEEDPRLPIDYLPTKTYGGEVINVLEWTVDDQVTAGTGWNPWEEIDVDTRDGDIIGEAIYDRNGTVEETYDVVITKEYLSVNGNPKYAAAFRANEQTNDEAYQMITLRTTGIKAFCLEGLMTDMNDLTYLHTDMPWWSADSVRSYTMGEALYFAAPEMLLRDKGATAVMFFNKKLASDHELDNLYELVRDGEWDWQAMIEMAETVTADMDGDDMVSSAEDIYGLYGGMRDIPYFMFAGSGYKFAEIDADGYLELTWGTEEIYTTIWQDVLDQVMYSDIYYGNLADSALIPEDFDVFLSGKVLFNLGLLKNVNGMRNMETDYGILPVPKYDSQQEDYGSLVWMHHDSVLGIPGSVTNTEVVSVVLEYMSYLSYYEVYPIFYDTILMGRSTRDEDSREMLEIVFRTRVFDPGQFWLSSSIHGNKSFLTLFETKTTNIASLWATLEGKAAAGVEEFNEKIDELNG